MKRYILDAATAEKKMRRMAFEILEMNSNASELILVGIRDNGFVLAERIASLLAEISQVAVKTIGLSLDKRSPDTITLSETMDFNGRSILLIDDVSNSGKTMLYALKPFLAFHPAKIQTLVLVERTHKTFPVNSDYVGISLATTMEEHIFVEVEAGQIKGAYLE